MIDLSKYFKILRFNKVLLIMFALLISSYLSHSQITYSDLEIGTYVSKCYPNEKIFFSLESGKNWWVAFITWKRGFLEKEYALLHNQKLNFCEEEIFEDQAKSYILRIKKNNQILLYITGKKSFKTSDGCEWKFLSDELPIKN